VAYKLQPGESLEDAAWEMLGDRRLTHQLTVLHGVVYLKDAERPGPPARWAGQPTQRKGPRDEGRSSERAQKPGEEKPA
jgi:hypothetical protein